MREDARREIEIRAYSHQSEEAQRIEGDKVTKRGNTYLRGLLTGGARPALIAAMRTPPEKRTGPQHWMIGALLRLGFYVSLVAIDNKHAHICGPSDRLEHAALSTSITDESCRGVKALMLAAKKKDA